MFRRGTGIAQDYSLMSVVWIDQEAPTSEGRVHHVASLLASMSVHLVNVAMAPNCIDPDQAVRNARAVVTACAIVAAQIRTRSAAALRAATQDRF